MRVVGFAAGLVACPASAQVFTKFYPTQLAPVGATLMRVAGPTTSCEHCESGTYAISGMEMLSLDCDGSCEARLVCRFPSGVHDLVVAAVAAEDSETHAEVGIPCDTTWFQITKCQPTLNPDGSVLKACKVRAWVW